MRHRGHFRRKYGRAGRGGTVDEHAVTELDLYAENEYSLYNQKKLIFANLQKKATKGVYDPVKAAKLWGYWVAAAAKKYSHEFPGVVFNKATRDALAMELARRYPNGQES